MADRPDPIDPVEVAAAVAGLDGWTLVDDTRIAKTYRFASFVEAFAFMTRCADLAEELNHHPEWSNVYSRVDIELTTHDVGGLSNYDIEFARRADGFLSQ